MLLPRRRAPVGGAGTMSEEWETRVGAWWGRVRGRVLGAMAGLLTAWIVLRIGFWTTLVIAVCLYVGYVVGRSFDPE